MQLFIEWIDKTPNELLLEAIDYIRKGLLMQNHRNKRTVLNLYYNKIGHEDKKGLMYGKVQRSIHPSPLRMHHTKLFRYFKHLILSGKVHQDGHL